ncbi:MAG: Hsp20/alpha crystallin family protein [Jatrophihabitans sp.]|nr:MAG: Hsp20/alpha crystallin family protein [Jatrophihabitans sp.]
MTVTMWERRWPVTPLSVTDGWLDWAFRDFFTGNAWFDRRHGDGGALIRLEKYVEGDTCVIRAELPGIDPDKDVEIIVSDGVLHLSGRREESTERDDPSGYRSEFRYGSFERSVRVPDWATENDVRVGYEDGILEVRIPIAPAAAPLTGRPRAATGRRPAPPPRGPGR